MKKKIVFLVGVAVVLLICGIVYFRPLSLFSTVSENSNITIVQQENAVGEARSDVFEEEDISAEQKSAIFSVFEEHSYRRTFGTPFSDGSLSETGNVKILSIHIADENSSYSIMMTSSGNLVVNGKNYRMKNAERFIDRIDEILSPAI